MESLFWAYNKHIHFYNPSKDKLEFNFLDNA